MNGRRPVPCGEACRKLTARQYRFHLLHPCVGLPGYPATLAEAHQEAGYSPRTKAMHTLRRPDVQAALEHHREGEWRQYVDDRERARARLTAAAEARPSDFFRIEVDDKGEASLSFVGFADLPPDYTRRLTGVEVSRSGKIKIRMEPQSRLDKVLLELAGELPGGREHPLKLDVDPEKLTDEELAAMTDAALKKAR